MLPCPRRVESFRQITPPATDRWRDDDTCSYCGSLNPDTFMARLEAGDVELEPTDKNYKVYVKRKGGDAFRQSYRDCPPESGCKGPDSCTHWVTRERDHTKFYFQHLSEEQKLRFIELLNERKLAIGYPGHFYAMPFFIRWRDEKCATGPLPRRGDK